MGALMDLVSGDERAILLAISVEDWTGLDDPSRLDAHLSLGGGLDPTWLDLFSQAARTVTGRDDPAYFLDGWRELDGGAEAGDRVVECVDHRSIDAVARLS